MNSASGPELADLAIHGKNSDTMSIARHHTEWLSLVPVSGPFLSLPVLMEAFPQGLDAHDAEHSRLLRLAYEEWDENFQSKKLDPSVHDAWIKFVLTKTLEYDESLLAEGQAIPQTLQVEVSEHGELLRPSLVLNDPGTKKARLLIQAYPRSQDLNTYVAGSRWKASPDTRMTDLLHATGVRLGLVTNGEHWMLVDAPKGETTGYASWYASLWREEKITLQAFRSLLSMTRLFGVSDDQAIETLLTKSASNQQEVTTQLGLQVLRAVEVLIQSLDRADQDHGRELLDGINEAVLYESALNVMMRLVFLFCAEERELIPTKPFPVYEQNYSVSTISRQLREIADQHGEELLERRFDAWPRLLSAFRAVYGGVRHDDVYMPAYGGRLFDPDRYPFLEGRKPKTSWQNAEATPLPVNNRTVLHLLEALQFLEMKVPGIKEKTLRRISFRHLDIEQIGHVYEGLLDHTAKRAAEPFLGLVGSKGKEPEVSLAELENHHEKGTEALLKFLKEETGRTPKSLEKDLNAEFDAQEITRFRTACQTEELWKRVEPFAGLIRLDSFGYPGVITAGSVFVAAGTDRRSSGTHYTPKSLTEPIVRYTLEPMVFEGPNDKSWSGPWKLKSAHDILNMKVCDIACGSGAFLVEACRYLATRLQEAWQELERQFPNQVRITPEGQPSTGAVIEELIPTDSDAREAYARRLIAQRCMYGVDKNPLAVEIAKLSLWLLTLAKDKPFEFLDHAIRHGDSLVGLHDLNQLRYLTLSGQQRDGHLYLSRLDDAINQAISLRNKLESQNASSIDTIHEQERYFHEASALTARLRQVADVLIGTAFDSDELPLISAGVSFQHGEHADLATLAEKSNQSRTPFHWPLEFPEVFITKGGFDACIGNPPFMGGQKITGFLGTLYREYLVHHLAKGKRGSADLCAYFFLRAAQLVRPGAGFGLIASNTIAQGDTREVAFDLLLAANFIVNRAHSSRPWPGLASLEISIVWVRRGGWNGLYVLDEKPTEGITAYLTPPNTVTGNPHCLKVNECKSYIGSYVLGLGFIITPEKAQWLIEKDSRNDEVLFPYLNGEELNSRPDQSPTRHVINFSDWPVEKAMKYADCFRIVEENVKPQRLSQKDKYGQDHWWQFLRTRPELYRTISRANRVLVRARIANTHSMAWVPNGWVYNEKTVVFSDCSFSVMQSNIHEVWAREYSSTLRTDMQYTPSDCFDTFAFPQPIPFLNEIGDIYHEHRKSIMLSRNEGLTKTYNRFHNRFETGIDIHKLRKLHVEMDRAVAAAYGWSDLDLDHDFYETKQGSRYTISETARREVLARLLKLNHDRYAEEVKQGLHDKKKPPKKTTSIPKTSKKSQPATRTLFGDDDATFPSTERDHFLCRLVCELVKAEPGLPISAYVDSLVIALGHKRYKQLLTGKDRTQFGKLCNASPLASWSAGDKIPWGELQNLLTRRKAIASDNQMIQMGPDLGSVLNSYPAISHELVVLLRKAAAELRDLQAQADPDNAVFVGEITPEKAEILKAISHDRSQWFGVAA